MLFKSDNWDACPESQFDPVYKIRGPDHFDGTCVSSANVTFDSFLAITIRLFLLCRALA